MCAVSDYVCLKECAKVMCAVNNYVCLKERVKAQGQ